MVEVVEQEGTVKPSKTADEVIRELWSIMGPTTPRCNNCSGCKVEHEMALNLLREYLGGDAYPAPRPPKYPLPDGAV